MKSENGKQCPQSHHPILHKSNALTIGVVMATETKEAILPVLSANIGNADDLFKRGNVLLDSGAQISLIRQELAETLSLTRKNASVTKVDGEDRWCFRMSCRRAGTMDDHPLFANFPTWAADYLAFFPFYLTQLVSILGREIQTSCQITKNWQWSVFSQLRDAWSKTRSTPPPTVIKLGRHELRPKANERRKWSSQRSRVLHNSPFRFAARKP